MVSFYMKVEALSWFKWMYNNHQLSDLFSFTHHLELRFGPSTYENHQAELFKLRQMGTVAEYQTNFERLCNRVLGLTPEAILNCYISGLTANIQDELAVHKPRIISEAIGLSKLLEAKIKDSKPKFHKNFNPSTSTLNRTINSLQLTSNPKPTPTSNHTEPPSSNPLPIKRMTPAQMQERRAHGLWFNCDEKFIPGHRCATPKFLLLLEEETVEVLEDEETPDPQSTTEVEATYFHLSVQALTGRKSPKTLRFQGRIALVNLL